MGPGTLEEVLDGRGTIGEVQAGSEDLRGGPGRDGGLSGRSGTGRETIGNVQDGLGDPREGLGWIGGPSGMSGKGRGNSDRFGTGRRALP